MSSSVLNGFKHIMYSTPFILGLGKPDLVKQEDWDLAIAALLALLEE